jgi:anti-sigma B factor antagonist
MPTDATDPTTGIVRLVGELDLDTAPTLTSAVEELIDQGHRHLVLDLTRLRFCDSMGLNALLRLLRRTKGVGGSLTLMTPPDQVKRLLSMAGLDQILARHDHEVPAAATVVLLPL